MKKNGFTLIELLATLALLAILSMVIVPSVIGVINKNKDNNLKMLCNSIEEAARLYVSDKRYTMGNVSSIKIKELMENNYLANSFVNPYDSNDIYTCDNNKITDDFVIIINKNKYVVKYLVLVSVSSGDGNEF